MDCIWYDSDEEFLKAVSEDIWGSSQPVNASAQQSVSSDGGRAIMSASVTRDVAIEDPRFQAFNDAVAEALERVTTLSGFTRLGCAFYESTGEIVISYKVNNINVDIVVQPSSSSRAGLALRYSFNNGANHEGPFLMRDFGDVVNALNTLGLRLQQRTGR